MNKKITLFAALLLLGSVSFGQTLYRTYYDYQKQHVQEEYYANSYGVKNGGYKKYSEYGGILMQGSFKNDKKEGLWIVKDEKGHLVSKLTYLDDVLNGEASYYNFDYIGSEAPQATGIFKNGLKEGTWTSIELLIGQEYQWYYSGLDFSNEKGCMDIKCSSVYKDGNELPFKNGKSVCTFYPSGKIFAEVITLNGIEIEKYIYYPNGKLYYLFIGDSTGKTMIIGKKWLYPQGGSKDSIPYYKEQVKVNEQKQKEAYAEQNKKAEKQKEAYAEQQKKATIEQRRQDSIAAISRKNQDAISAISRKTDSLYNFFKSVYVVIKQSTLLGVPLVNANTQQPIYSKTYPNGEYLFQKSDTLFKFMYHDCQNTPDVGSQINKYNTMVALLNKLISFSATDLNGKKITDTKALDKQMKKAATMDEIKRVLGMEN